ncbi:PH domain-containing protein [Patescibacteria group bacterium]|nr:MAG: PH domain-containing protein [Patescibacteria group bacterium]
MKQLDKKAVWLFFLSSVFGSFVLSMMFTGWVVLIAIEGIFDGNWIITLVTWLVLIFLVLIALSFIWAKLSYHYYRYELTDLGFRKESGVIWKKYVTIPYARIQNVDINRGILARLLGLSDLHIQTAGASASISRYGMAGISAEGRLPGVSKADAEVLRDELVKRASGSLGQGV